MAESPHAVCPLVQSSPPTLATTTKSKEASHMSMRATVCNAHVTSFPPIASRANPCMQPKLAWTRAQDSPTSTGPHRHRHPTRKHYQHHTLIEQSQGKPEARPCTTLSTPCAASHVMQHPRPHSTQDDSAPCKRLLEIHSTHPQTNPTLQKYRPLLPTPPLAAS